MKKPRGTRIRTKTTKEAEATAEGAAGGEQKHKQQREGSLLFRFSFVAVHSQREQRVVD